MKYVVNLSGEKFEITEQDKEKIEQAVDEDIKFVELSNGRTIDPLNVRDFNPVKETQIWYNINNFDLGEEHRERMLEKLNNRRVLFSKYIKNKERLEIIKKQGETETDENKKEELRQKYRKIQKEQKDWEDIISEIKKKDTRKRFVREYSPYKQDGKVYYRLLEHDNKTNKVRVVVQSILPPKGWKEGRTRYLTID